MCKKMFIAKGKVLGMAVCICLLSGLLSGCGKTGDEKDTPTVNSGATIEPAPEAVLTPEPAPEAVLTPEPAPEATLAPTPEPTSKPTPVPTPEPTPKPSPNPLTVSLVQKGTVKDNGEYKGLDWLVTDAGELVVTGQMEGNGLDSAAIWQDAPWKQYSKEITSACLNFTGAKSLQDLFYGYSALSEVDLVNLDTSSVTNMTAMFQNCISLGSIDVSGFDTSSVTGMSNMFCGCTSLGNIDVSSFDTSSVRGMSYMFCSCESVVSLDLSGFDTSSVQNMDCMFASCRSLQEILAGEQWLQPNRVERMFYNCNITSVTRK